MFKRALGMLAVLALSAAGCGGGSSGPGEGGGTPKQGGSVSIGLRADFLSLDPLVVNNDSDYSVANGIYDTLIERVGDKGSLGPRLAETWEPSADLKTWTVKLRQDVKFHDGTPFNADAVVFNIQRHMDAKNSSRQLADALLIDSVTTVDQYTVAIRLKTPWIDFPQVLVGAIGLIGSPTAIKQLGAEFGKRPVGTGPFVFKEWVPGDHITGEKNPNYWKQGLPYLDKVTWRPIPDQDSKYAALKSGQIDIAQVPTADQVTKAEKDSKLRVQKFLGVGGTFVMFNTKAEPFSDLNARLAVSYATDRKEIVDQITLGKQRMATGPFPQDSEWYSKVEEPSYDADKAKQALSAYGKPLKFKFNIVADPITRQYAQVLQAQWKRANIEAELVQTDQATLITAAVTHQFQAQIFQYGDWYDPDRGFFNPFYSKAGPQNFTNYGNQAVDAALLQARATSDPSARKQLYATFAREIGKDAPYVWLHFNTTYTIMNKRVQNLPTMYSSISRPAQVWVSDAR